MKAALSGHERRQEIRYSLVGEIPARMINVATQQELTFLTIDISHRGLGLLVTPSPDEGQIIRLDFVDQRHPNLLFVCRHVHAAMEEPLLGFESMRRCGLELTDDQQATFDLVECFARFDSVMIGD